MTHMETLLDRDRFLRHQMQTLLPRSRQNHRHSVSAKLRLLVSHSSVAQARLSNRATDRQGLPEIWNVVVRRTSREDAPTYNLYSPGTSSQSFLSTLKIDII